MDLTGRVVVVTGASRGIGAATARAAAGRGAVVVAVGRDRAALATLVQEIGGSFVVAEAADPGSGEVVVAHAMDRHGRVDVVVANAGVGQVGPFADQPVDRLVELVDVNLRAPLLLAKAAVGPMVETGGLDEHRRAAFVFVSSIAGAVGVPGESVYSAAKAGLDAFAVVLREELREPRISVSTVVPGVVATGFLTARETPYERRFPRPMPAERVAATVLRAIDTGADRLVVPRWLVVPARLAATTPRIYRRLARRFG